MLILSIDVGYKNLGLCLARTLPHADEKDGGAPPLQVIDLRREDCLDGKKKRSHEDTSRKVAERVHHIIKNEHRISRDTLEGEGGVLHVVLETQVRAAPINIALKHVISGVLFGLLGPENVKLSFMRASKKFAILALDEASECVHQNCGADDLHLDNLKRKSVQIAKSLWENTQQHGLFTYCARCNENIFIAEKRKADDIADALIQLLTFFFFFSGSKCNPDGRRGPSLDGRRAYKRNREGEDDPGCSSEPEQSASETTVPVPTTPVATARVHPPHVAVGDAPDNIPTTPGTGGPAVPPAAQGEDKSSCGKGSSGGRSSRRKSSSSSSSSRRAPKSSRRSLASLPILPTQD